MKTKFLFATAIAALLGICIACTKKEEAPTELKVGKNAVAFEVKGGEAAVELASNAQWDAVSSAEWVTVTPATGNGNATITVKAAENTAGVGEAANARNAIITFTAKDKTQKLNVTQVGETIIFTVTGETATIPYTGGKVNVKVEYNSPYTVTIQAGADWIAQIDTKSVATDELSFAVAPNDGTARSARIFFKASKGGEQEVTINQEKKPFKPSFPGDGSASNPYTISTPALLEEFSYVTNTSELKDQFCDKCFSITADIDMTGRTFTSVAQDATSPFKGTLDGGNHTISNLKIANIATKAAGLVAYADGATLKDIKLSAADIDSKYVYCGSIVGYAKNGSKIQNVSVAGKVREYTSSITAEGVANAGISGGLVGYLENSSLEGGTVDAEVTFYGKFSGGVVGLSQNSTVSDCHFLKDHFLNIYYHFSGGIVGRARGENTLIKNCSFEGGYTTVGYVMGGIVGQLLGGKVENCVLGSCATVGSDKYFVGGIVGTAQPEYEIVIDHCACYGTIRGAYSVGGIVGYTGLGSVATDIPISSATKPVTIKACATIGAEITATQGNSSSYPIAAGILGWSHGSNKLTLTGCFSQPGIIQTTYGANANGVLSGICAYQNSTGGVAIENCYTSFTPNELVVCNDPITSTDKTWYAGIAIRCTQPTNINNCYTSSSMRIIEAQNAAVLSGSEQLADADMTSGTLLTKLRLYAASGVVWVAGSNKLPTISGLPADPHIKKKAAKRISVIGDSISTFKGWIPGGYSAHYPCSDGTLTLVNETYWYRLIKDYMKDAEFDTNIAFSGSTVTNTTAENYVKRYGTATNAWWHNSFVERFAACGGCGHPDIILIHGGTNDWAHNADPLAPGVEIRNDASNIYAGVKPDAAKMASMYAVADAAKTRAAINALPDGTFCEAYIKLMCQIRERYPKCKVVCIIGDYLSQSVEQSVLDIADHYGAKTVNLFRVNGFNDLGGYSPETLSNKGRQPNMPKHDYSGDISGCHPGSQAMKFIAEKIYTELGTWLEE